MENAYKMRITCNPYTKEIVYECYEKDGFVNISELSTEYCSELINDKFTKTSFQNRAYEIVELLNKYFNPGNKGLHIDFIGNNDDYNTLESVISTYFDDCNIIGEKNNQYFNEAPYVMQRIETRFDDVVSTLENSEYIKDEIAAEISKYKDTIEESIAICVTGLCSSGKSAFINSLIGYEILPSSSDPTTAKMFKISCGDTYLISFEVSEQNITISFSGDDYTVSENCPSELVNEINSVFADDKADNEFKNIHRLLDYLNKGKLLPDIGKVDIKIPFRQMTYSDSHYKFVIYDTPGSNSDSNRKHFDILKESLSKQTNALLILLTTPDTMDFTDNNNLLDLIQKTGESLDTSNAIIVVNKGDILTPGSLSEKRERYQNLKITKWKSTRIFFLSSVIALASKKDDPDDKSSWVDQDAFDVYDDRCRKFIRGDKVLYKYNIIDKSKEIAPVVKEGDVSDTTLFINSGLASIEHEISDYALRYALYNKCSRATEYLQRAIQLCENNVREIEHQRDDELTSTQTLFENKQRILAEYLDNKQSSTASGRSIEFRERINQSFDEFKTHKELLNKGFLQIRKISIFTEFEHEWKNISALKEQQGFNMDEALRRMESKVRYRYNALLNAFSADANEIIGKFWEKATQIFKTDCKNIITNSDVLNDEQKAIMNSILLNTENMTRTVVEFDLRSIHAVKRAFFGKDKYDNTTCCKNFIQELDNAVMREIDIVCKNNSRYFEEWSKSLVSSIKTKLCTFNTDLHDWEIKIEELNRIIEEKKKHLKLLEDTKKYVCHLLVIQSK